MKAEERHDSLGPPESVRMLDYHDDWSSLEQIWWQDGECAGSERDLTMEDQFQDTLGIDRDVHKNSKHGLTTVVLKVSYERRKEKIGVYFF